MPERDALSLASDPAGFREARRWLADVARRAGLDPGASHDAIVALTEACANAYRHAYSGREDGRIDLEATWDDAGLRVTVRDYGDGFEPEGYREPSLGDLAEGGYGLFLMKNLMDDVHVRPAGRGTEVVMVKARRGANVEAACVQEGS